MKKKLIKINIISIGRRHLLDTARELNNQGYDIKFYSYVNNAFAKNYGLPKQCNKSLFYYLLPILVLNRFIFKGRLDNIQHSIQDYITSILIRKCDISIVNSFSFSRTINTIKHRDGKLIIDHGTSHTSFLKDIIDKNCKNYSHCNLISDKYVKKMDRTLKTGDYIILGSEFTKRTFIDKGYKDNCLFVNQYGVNLKDFHFIKNINRPFDIIMVGNWSYMKGCNILTEAINKLKLKFLHVGSISDCPFPKNNLLFTHIGSVSEKKLINYYSQAKIFVMPSIQEGFGMVYCQAAACGLPIICTNNTGGPDIRQKLLDKNKKRIQIINSNNTKELCQSILFLLNIIKKEGYIDYFSNCNSYFSLDGYGKRYNNFIESITKEALN